MTKAVALLAILFFLSCKTSTHTQSNKENISAPEYSSLVDSMLTHRFRYEWFSAKAKVLMTSGSGTTEFSAYIRARKDSVIWISVSPALGIEVARVLISSDSIRIIDRLNNKYISEGYDFFNTFTALPLGFEVMQDLLSGNALYSEGGNFISTPADSFFHLHRNENKTVNNISLNSSFQMAEQMISDSLHGSVQMKTGEYDTAYTPPFSLWRKITVAANQATTFEISLSKIKLNEPLTFPFRQ